MTKGKVLQIGLLISLIGLITYKLSPQVGFEYLTANMISSLILILIVILWVSSYIYRVINGKMTFMEQRKRYRKEYEKIMDEKLQTKFNSMTKEDQEKLIQELEEN